MGCAVPGGVCAEAGCRPAASIPRPASAAITVLSSLFISGLYHTAPRRAKRQETCAPMAELCGMNNAFPYPDARKSDQTDNYHGTEVADPYRWLEDPDSPESRAWIEAENALVFGFLEKIPARQAIEERLTTLWNYERYGMPSLQGGRYFYGKNDGLQNQSVLYVAEALDAPPRVLLDPNTLSVDGTVALSGTATSDDGKFFAYGLSAAGSDWTEWHVRNVDTGEDTDDLVRWVKFSGASWAKDGFRLLLQPLRCAARRRGTTAGQLFPEALFSHTRHRSIRRRAGVRAA